MCEEAKRLAKKQINYLNKQIREAELKINGLVPEYDEKKALKDFMIDCDKRRIELAKKYKLYLRF